jgi:hypothetical protein
MTDHAMWSSDERAQVYAHDLRLGPGAPLVYLPRGGADAVRDDVRAGHLVCPLPDCNSRELTVRGKSRRDHFAHRTAPTSDHAPERLMHLQGKWMIADWLRSLFGSRLKVGIEVAVQGRARVADVMARSPRGGGMVFEIQYSALEPAEWQQRHDDYVEAGLHDVWLWGRIPPHCRPVVGEHFDGERMISPAMQRCRRETGRPLLWINPEEHQLALALTAGDIDLYEDLREMLGTDARMMSWAFLGGHAAVGLVADLSDWTLGRRGPTSESAAKIDRLQARMIARAEARRREQAVRNRRDEERRAEREQLAKWRQDHEEELAERRALHAKRDRIRWEREAPALIARTGGALPAPIATRLPSDRGVFMAPEHWHAIVYLEHLHAMQPDEAFAFRDVCRTVFRTLNGIGIHPRTSKPVCAAIGGFLCHLRREGWIAFDTVPGSYWIDGLIRMGPHHPTWLRQRLAHETKKDDQDEVAA